MEDIFKRLDVLEKRKAWNELAKAAIEYTSSRSSANAKTLAGSGERWALAKDYAPPSSQSKTGFYPLKNAWDELVNAAAEYASSRSAVNAQTLANSGEAWALAKGYKPPSESQPTKLSVVPFGRSKGTPLKNATTRDLRWVEGCLSESIHDPGKARWKEKNEADLAAIQEELERRGDEDYDDDKEIAF